MALPKIDVPTYELELPVSKKRIKYRPFLVKEQRNLLMAIESSDAATVHQSVRTILDNCTLTENIDIGQLPIIDVEYYFLNLRAKSVGEIVESRYRCNNVVESKECGNIMEKEIDLTKIKVDIPENIQSEIQITNEIIVKLKYPDFSVVKDSLEYEDINEVTFMMVAESIDYIYDSEEEQFYYGHETSKEELIQWVESLSQEQFDKIEVFFNNLPKLKETIKMTCGKCGFNHTIEVEGLESFFG
jgi:hypothetical protein